jgi:hypothetical protein
MNNLKTEKSFLEHVSDAQLTFLSLFFILLLAGGIWLAIWITYFFEVGI